MFFGCKIFWESIFFIDDCIKNISFLAFLDGALDTWEDNRPGRNATANDEAAVGADTNDPESAGTIDEFEGAGAIEDLEGAGANEDLEGASEDLEGAGANGDLELATNLQEIENYGRKLSKKTEKKNRNSITVDNPNISKLDLKLFLGPQQDPSEGFSLKKWLFRISKFQSEKILGYGSFC